MKELVLARLRESGPTFYYIASGMALKIGDYLIVEAERGIDYAQVVSEIEAVVEDKIEELPRKIVRIVNSQDLKQIQDNIQKAKDAFATCQKKIGERKLEMKLVEAEYSFDGSKIIFYFTAEGRIDFRELVKDLARIFKSRIELRQIGVRDEAKLFGGFGPCGRPLCCSKFLKNFEPVTIRMAKDQALPLNPPKISGLCGRLMCCLSYEYSTYKELLKGLPKEGEQVHTPQGKGKVISVNALKRSVVVEIEKDRQIEVKY
ncbi:MAG: stage 0 sporulation family protein [Candidatus Omnitrophota bacterium]